MVYTIEILKEKGDTHIDHIIELQIINHVLNSIKFKFSDFTIKRIVDYFNSVENIQVIDKNENLKKNQLVQQFIIKKINNEKIDDQEILKLILLMKKKWGKIKEDFLYADNFSKKMDELFENY